MRAINIQHRGERVGRRVGGVGIGRLRLLLRLGVEKMVMDRAVQTPVGFPRDLWPALGRGAGVVTGVVRLHPEL